MRIYNRFQCTRHDASRAGGRTEGEGGPCGWLHTTPGDRATPNRQGEGWGAGSADLDCYAKQNGRGGHKKHKGGAIAVEGRWPTQTAEAGPPAMLS
jgi:hypothetical protein